MRLGGFLYHVASGHAFFTGLALVVFAVLVAVKDRGRWRRTASLLALFGVLSIAISATPLPWPAYFAGAAAILLWGFVEARGIPHRSEASTGGAPSVCGLTDAKSRTEAATHPSLSVLAARTLLIATCLAGAALELPYHRAPHPKLPFHPTVAVIADSVTAGIGEKEAVTWPRLIADRTGLAVHDYSEMGATVASARKQAAKLTPDDNVVLLEIGGNDLLGGTTSRDFDSGLDALLRDVRSPGRTVLMFELPLPPGFNSFGLIQRRLAAQHGIHLIPKRVLMGVFAAKGATLDSIHLSQSGHDRIADTVADVLGDL